MRRLYRKLLWSLVAMLALVSICLVWLFTADLGAFKPQLEQFISKQINRELAINGELDINLGRKIEISAENVILENADWAEAPAMVDVGRLAARVDLWSIVSPPIIIELVDLDDVTVNLEQSESDHKNWEFELADSADKPEVEDEPLDLWLETLEVNSVHIVFDSAHRPQPVDILIKSLRQNRRDDDMLESSLDATVNKQAVELQGTWGTWTSLLAQRDVEFDMNGHLGEITVRARGLIDDLGKPSRPELEFRMAGPRVALVSEMLGLGEVGDGDIDLSGSLGARNDGPLILNLKGNLGQTQVDATATTNAIDDFADVDVSAKVSGPNLGQVISYFGVDQVGEAPFEIALDLRRSGKVLSLNDARVVFGESRLEATGELPDFPTLKDATIRVEIVGPRVENLRHLLDIPGFATGPFYVGLDVATDESGKPGLKTTLQTELARIVAEGVVGDPPDYVGTALDFEFDAPSLLKLGQIASIENLPDQPVTARGSVARQEGRLDLTGPIQIETESVAASISGAVRTSPRLLGTAVDIEIIGADLRDTLRHFQIDAGLPPLSYEASGSVHLRAEGIGLQGIKASLGASTVELDGLISNAPGSSGSYARISARGPSMEELFSGLDNVNVMPGAFETSASVRLTKSDIHIENFDLSRERGQVKLDGEIGLPLATRRLGLDVDASGIDIRSLFSDLGGFEPDSATFRMNGRAELDGDEWSFQPMQVSLGDASAEARGQLAVEAGSVSGSLRIEADVPNLATLGRFQTRQFAPQPLHLSGTLKGDRDLIVVDDLSASLNNSDIAGHLTYRFGDIPDVEVDLESESLTILPIFVEDTEVPKEEPADEDGRIIPAVTVPFELLNRFNATFGISIGALQRNDFSASNINLQGNVSDGALTIDVFRLDTRGGVIETSGEVIAREIGGYSHIKLAAESIAMTSSPDHPVRGDVNFDVVAEGSNLQELAANSNGFFVLHATDGEIGKNPALELLFGGFATELLSVINPFEKSVDTTTLDCSVLAVRIADGMVTGSPAVYFQSNAVRVLSDATISLKTEEIKLAFETLPGKGLKLMSIGEMVNPYFSVTGTFSEPRIKLDEKSAVIAGGAAVATAGLSILAKGLIDRLKSSGDACARAATYAETFAQTGTNQDNP